MPIESSGHSVGGQVDPSDGIFGALRALLTCTLLVLLIAKRDVGVASVTLLAHFPLSVP